jgi:hypothetical protein
VTHELPCPAAAKARVAAAATMPPMRAHDGWRITPYKLELEDGTPADPSTYKTAATSWRPGDTIPLGRERILRVIDVRPGAGDDDPVRVVVEDDPFRF